MSVQRDLIFRGLKAAEEQIIQQEADIVLLREEVRTLKEKLERTEGGGISSGRKYTSQFAIDSLAGKRCAMLMLVQELSTEHRL